MPMLGSGIVPGAWITKQIPMLVNKDFQIWNLIGWQHFTATPLNAFVGENCRQSQTAAE